MDIEISLNLNIAGTSGGMVAGAGIEDVGVHVARARLHSDLAIIEIVVGVHVGIVELVVGVDFRVGAIEVLELLFVFVTSDANEASVSGNLDCWATFGGGACRTACSGLGEKEVLLDIVALEAMDEGEEDRVVGVVGRVPVGKVGVLSGGEAVYGGVGAGAGEEDREGGEEGGGVGDAVGFVVGSHGGQ